MAITKKKIEEKEVKPSAPKSNKNKDGFVKGAIVTDAEYTAYRAKQLKK